MPTNPTKYVLILTATVAIILAMAMGYWLGASSTDAPTTETHTQNRLSSELSPYLRLHAHNPVDWYPWGPEALSKAKKENKPIFLSVGYSSCYWCHVMERLVFSDPDIAAQMNQFFVNIKVDREERPDLDEIYMTATHLITGRGGWPNSVFLTPDLQPFFAGTYFPPKDAHGRPGFPRVIQALHIAWQENRPEIEKQAQEITHAIERIHTPTSDRSAQNIDLITHAIDHIKSRFDPLNGGLGTAPKFPPDHALSLLLTAHNHTSDDQALKIITQSLDHMARGGIRDHLGGGFHRYATDAQWRVPHFEKMLYNQAFQVHNYVSAYAITQKPSYRIAAEEVLDFVSNILTSPEGGFYSALDAETKAEEGAYYTWTEQEIREILKADANFFLSCYALAPVPDSAAEVLYQASPDSALATLHDTDTTDLHARLKPLKQKLLTARSKRIRPLLDDKIITAWNGLMIGAFAHASEVFGRPQDLQTAEKAAHFLKKRLKNPGLYRLYRKGQTKGRAYQEDYAYLIDGLLYLYRATDKQEYLDEAQTLSAQMHQKFWDAENGGYFLTETQDELIVRSKSPHDSALPSGNAVALHTQWTLYKLTKDPLYSQRADQLTMTFASLAAQTPGAFLHFTHGTMKAPGYALADHPSNLIQATATALPSQLSESIKVNVQIQIAPGWHIQASDPTEAFLIPTQVTLNSEDAQITQIDYPLPQTLLFSFSDAPLAVYADTLEIRLTIAIENRPQSLSLSLHYQACDSTRCLLPETLPIELQWQ